MRGPPIRGRSLVGREVRGIGEFDFLVSSPSSLPNSKKVKEVFVGGVYEVDFYARKDEGEEKI